MTNEELYTFLIDLISAETNEFPLPYTLGKFEGISWFQIPSDVDVNPKDYPLLTMKQYEKTVNLYAYLWDRDEALSHELEQTFGKSAMGKSCIRIKTLNQDRIAAIKNIISKLQKQRDSI